MLLAAALTLGMFAVVKPLTDRLHIKWCRKEISTTYYYTVSFIALPVVSAVPHHFSINIMYSAFLAGYVAKSISANNKTALDRMEAVKNFSFSFFFPIYFALVGIQLNPINHFSITRFALFFAIAFGLEAIGTTAMIWFTKLKRSAAVNFAVTMNARGGPGIVLQPLPPRIK